jgi:ribonuclease-3
MMNDEDDFTGIEQILGYHFFERQHLIRALTHPAYANELLQQNKKCMDQEAYSTLGDAVLKTGLILFLMERGVTTKGEITRRKEELESNVNLAKIGKRLKIRNYIRLGRGTQDLWRSGEETILADTIEALIGAIFLDSDTGFGIVKQCIGKWFEPELKKPVPAKHMIKEMMKEIPVAEPAVKKPRGKSKPKKPEPAKKPEKERLVPRPVNPIPSSSRRGAPRGTTSVSRQRSTR